MEYYLSVDSGGTKTAYLLTDESGRTVGRYMASGCTCSVMGAEKVYWTLKNGVCGLLKECGVKGQDIRYAVWGISCFGEYETLDRYLTEKLPELFPCGCYLCNDVETGLAGSLQMQSGIHIIAGTGAIIMGKNRAGQKARANGWHEVFSDEGSAYWLGIKALALFAKQADKREKRSHLYELFYEYLKLEKDMDIVSFYQNHLAGKREKVAALQRILLEAAVKGDQAASKLYRKAALELAESVTGVAGQLNMTEENLPVSYYGGVFKAGALVLEPLAEYLRERGFLLVPPKFSPLGGGILIAAEKCRRPFDEVTVWLEKEDSQHDGKWRPL